MGETWIDPEELAYPTGSVHGSRRRGLVRFADGKLRMVRLGVPDTFFSIPAKPSRGPVGVVMVGNEQEEYTFHAFKEVPK